jgi:hypothetical protein
VLVFYCIILLCATFVCFFVIWFLPSTAYLALCLVSRCRSLHLPHFGFADGTSRSTQNLASAAWAIYAPTNELISLHGVCLGRATNNIAEYSAVIELLTDAISLGIRRLVIRLDSQLVVLQLSNVYAI